MKASWCSTNGPEVGVHGRPGLVDEVGLAVRACGIAIEGYELLDDDLAHRVEPTSSWSEGVVSAVMLENDL